MDEFHQKRERLLQRLSKRESVLKKGNSAQWLRESISSTIIQDDKILAGVLETKTKHFQKIFAHANHPKSSDTRICFEKFYTEKFSVENSAWSRNGDKEAFSTEYSDQKLKAAIEELNASLKMYQAASASHQNENKALNYVKIFLGISNKKNKKFKEELTNLELLTQEENNIATGKT